MEKELVKFLENFIGVKFETCDHFTKRIRKQKGVHIVDVILDAPSWISNNFDALIRINEKYPTITTTYAGYKRVRIILTGELPEYV